MSDGYGVRPDAWNTGSSEPTPYEATPPGPVYPDDPTVSLPRWNDEPTQTGFIPGAWQAESWPGPPAGPPPRPPRRSQSLVALWVVLAVFVLVGIGVGTYAIAHHSSTHPARSGPPGAVAAPSNSPASVAVSASVSAPVSPPSDGASATADADAGATVAAKVDNLLDQSVSVRAGVQPALNRIAACRAAGGNIDALQHAADVRRTLSSQAATMSFEPVANGSALKAALTRLLTASANADDAYVQWGTDQRSCHGHAANDAAKKRGDRYSEQATSFKTSFLRLWNPVAEQYGLPTREQGDI